MFADAGALKKSKKGKKKAADMDAIFATLNGDADAAGDTQANGFGHHEQDAAAALGQCRQHAC